MKKIFGLASLLATLSFVFIGCVSRVPRVTLAFDSPDTDTISYLYSSLANQMRSQPDEPITGDVIRAEGDSLFTIELPDDQQTYMVWIYRSNKPMPSSRSMIRMMLFPGEYPHLDVTVGQLEMLDYTLSGSPALSAESVHRRENFDQLELELESLVMAYQVIQNESTKRRMEEEMNRLGDSILQIKVNYITQHPRNPLAGYYVATLRHPQLTDSLYTHVLADSIKNSNLKEFLDLSITNAREALE
jgi:hypothetical protein